MSGQSLGSVTLVLGGARSGKSAYAEHLVATNPGPWLYVATAEPRDAEMHARIAGHRARRGADWRLLEAPRDLASALATSEPALVDCLTLWITNHMLAGSRPDWPRLLAALNARRAPTVLVSNEVGLGVVPDNVLGREFRDEAGRLHQLLAARADHVIFMVAGLPLKVK